MTDTDKPMPGYFPLHAAKDPMTGAVCFAPMLRFDMDDPNAPDAGHSLADAIVMAIDESADGVGDADGKVIYDRADCERLFELAQDLKNLRYRFPSEFLAKKRWVLWKPIWNEAKKKFGKPPFSPLTGRALSGEMGSAEREANYVDFDAVETAALKYRLKVGINLTAEDNCVVVDFDDAFKDGVIDSTVTTWLKHLPSYTEYSASRAGLHIIGLGTINKKVDAHKVGEASVELFHNSFIACTGLSYGDHKKIASIQSGVGMLLDYVRIADGKTADPTTSEKAERPPMSKRRAARIHANYLEELRHAPEGAGNSTLNTVSWFAAKAFAAGALNQSEQQIRDELFRIVTQEWSTPHDEAGALKTIDSGWRKGLKEPLAIREETDLERKTAEFNEKYCVIQNYGGKARVVWFQADDHPDFAGRQHLVNQGFEDFNKAHNDRVEINGKLEKVRFVPIWLKSEGLRREYNRVIFQPEQEVSGCLNLWQGWAVTPKKGDCQRYRDHLGKVICDGSHQYYDHLIKTWAYAVRHPNERGHSAIVLRGPKGAGKNLAVDGFGRLWGQHFLTINNAEHFLGRFNHHLRDCSVLCANEAFYAGNKTHEAALKALITDPMMPIEQKFVDLTMCPNLLHVIVVTNASWVVPATTDERRFFVLDVSDKMTGDKAYFKALAAQTETPNAALLWYLLHEVDLTGFDPRFVPATKALYDQMSHGLEDAEAAWFECLCRGELPGVVSITGLRGFQTVTASMASGDFIEWARKRNRKWANINEEKIGLLFKGNLKGRKGLGFKKGRVGGHRCWEITSLVESRHAWSKNRFPVDWEDTSEEWQEVPFTEWEPENRDSGARVR